MNYVKNGKKFCPETKAIREKVIEDCFIEAYELLCQDNKEVINNFLNRIDGFLRENNTKSILQKLEVKKQGIENKINSLINLMIDGTIDKETFNKKKIELNKKIKKIEKDQELFKCQLDDENSFDFGVEKIRKVFDKEAKDIMVIGAGDGGVVRELTRYDRVRHIDLVEMDPMVVEACRAYLPENACRLDDRRVHLHYENALRFIRRCEAKYDLIIVDSSDPFGPSEGLFTREFYGNCYNALKDGIMVNQQGSPFYAEDAHAMQRSHKRIASTFQISRVYQAHIPTFAAGYWLFGFASKKYHPVDDLDAEAWNALNLRTRYYTTRLHKGAFYLPAFLEDMLKEVEE
mgnify:CR=1 FL=1